MASINASTSGAGGVITTADATGNLSLQSGGTTIAALTSTGMAVTGTLSASGVITSASGIVPGYQYYELNTGYTGSNVATAQMAFGVGVTLASSTIYEFEYNYALSKTAGTTSHTISILFGGTATINNIGYTAISINNTADLTSRTAAVATYGSSLSSIGTSNATVLATVSHIFHAKGIVSINAGGTFIPQYILSAAPGGAYTTQIGGYFKIAPLGASGSNITIGSWA